MKCDKCGGIFYGRTTVCPYCGSTQNTDDKHKPFSFSLIPFVVIFLVFTMLIIVKRIPYTVFDNLSINKISIDPFIAWIKHIDTNTKDYTSEKLEEKEEDNEKKKKMDNATTQNNYVHEIDNEKLMADAKMILVDQTYYGKLSSTWMSEPKWYRFSIDEDSNIYVIIHTKKQNDNIPYWNVSIRSDDGSIVWQKYIDGYTEKTISNMITLNEGIYYFEIESSTGYSNDQYSFLVANENNNDNSDVEQSIIEEKNYIDDVSNMEYVLPDSNSRFYARSELEGFNKEKSRLARNEIYARHGRLFDDELLQTYFNSKEWYSGRIEPSDFQESVFNEYEIYNRDLIVSYEEEMGYR